MIYKELLDKYQKDLEKISRTSDSLSIWRSIVGFSIPVLIYFMIKSDQNLFFGALIFALVFVFIFLVRRHTLVQKEKRKINALVEINQNEVFFIEKLINPAKDGKEFLSENSDFAYDLDFFGHRSLFHHLNRTHTYIGSQKLSALLVDAPVSVTEIHSRQECIEELSQNLPWRQQFASYSFLVNDEKKDYDFLIEWASLTSYVPKNWVNILAYLLPALLFASYISFFAFGFAPGYPVGNLLFLVNLGFAGKYFKDIKLELASSDNLERILSHYSKLLEEIESKPFSSEYLKHQQKKLLSNNIAASEAIKNLAVIYNNLNSASNPLGAAIFNGLMLFHLHTFISLRKWKARFAENIATWLQVIGEVEAITCLSNFRYNNPEYAFPSINDKNIISVTDLGHPLIEKSKRICNDINFDDAHFFILTGSNMSGKSTFLRSVGINMILAGIGAPVCASNASIHPKKVLVSMRLSDSLSNAESYFYAEVKRLKYILETVKKGDCFVLLDEILRGTNSEDKQFGTMEYIKQLISTDVLGIIATHDLEVCKLADEFPNDISNRYFAVEIANNELVFDYKLRHGICNSKSASFMMKKMGVI